MTAAPAIDGKGWIAVGVINGNVAPTTQATDRTFSLFLREPDEDTGDLARYQLYSQRDQRKPVRIDNDFTAWAYITPDSH